MAKTIEELEALKSRLEGDIRRSRMIDPDGVNRNTPLFRNLEQVNRDIEAAQTKTTTTTEVLNG
jgi:hypothetical protein